MHRGRFGGNARKRKAKLTDASFNAVLGVPTQADVQLYPVPREPGLLNLVAEEPEAVGRVPIIEMSLPVFDLVAKVRLPGDARPFSCQDYEFGYATCTNCHNDQAYYVHRSDLLNGYAFRCRVCRLEVILSARA